MKYIGLDLGSSYTKGAVLDTEAGTIDLERKERTPARAPGPEGSYEIDADAYFAAVQKLLHSLLDSVPEVQGILFSTQMHGFVLTDDRFLPCTNYISWQDRLSLTQDGDGQSWLERLAERVTPEMMRVVGAPLKCNQALSALYARAQQGLTVNRRFHTLGGYIIARLTGEHVCHITNAAPCGMADITLGAWDGALMEAADLCALSMPRIMSAVAPCGRFFYRERSYVVYPDIGDHQACVLGSSAAPDTHLCANIGTAGLLSLITGDTVPGGYEVRPYFDGLFLRSVSGLPGGRHLDLIVRFLQGFLAYIGREDDPAVWKAMAECPDVPGPKVDLTGCFDGTGGSIADIVPPLTFEGFISGIYRGIAGRYADAAQQIGGLPGRIAYVGGCALKNPALRSHISTATGLRAVEASDRDGVMWGLLQLAHSVKAR